MRRNMVPSSSRLGYKILNLEIEGSSPSGTTRRFIYVDFNPSSRLLTTDTITVSDEATRFNLDIVGNIRCSNDVVYIMGIPYFF